MNDHIDKLISEYNSIEEAYKNTAIISHLRDCKRCKRIFNEYFHTIELLKQGRSIPLPDNNECNNLFENILIKAKENKKFKDLKIIAMAAGIVLILITTFFYFNQKKTPPEESHNGIEIMQIISEPNIRDIEIISELDLFANLELIENIELIEEISKVMDDEI